MAGDVNSANVLRNLAKDLLTPEENAEFKSALQTYRTTSSITGLVAQLTKVVTSTEKLMLLVEIGCFLPEPIRRDFQKLCCLHFPKYDTFLTYFTPNSVGERNTTIAKDRSGQFQVISAGLDDQFFAPNDQRSLQGESGIDVNSDVDDISRHGGDASSLGNSWKIESRSQRATSVSSHAGHSAASAPTPKGSVTSSKQIEQSWKQSHTSLPTDQGGIRNRARSLRVLSGSMPSVLAMRGSIAARPDDRVKILLKRREDGSLGLGVRGGKEYNAPIEVFQVEAGSQGERQGLRVGDRILDVNGNDFTNITHAEAVMMMRNAWNIIMIVQHKRWDHNDSHGDCLDGGIGSTSLDDWEVAVYPTKKGKLGCGVYRDKLNYIVVKKVDKNSPASKAGLSKGDRFLEIEDIPVCGLTDKQVATLTTAKRIRIKILRPAASIISTRAPSESIDFNTMFSPLTLDLSKLDGNEIGQNRDDDQNTFISSTPKRATTAAAVGRSHSEERQGVHNNNNIHQAEIHQRPRSASQNPNTSRTSQGSGDGNNTVSKNSRRPLPPTPSSPHNSRPVTPDSPALSVKSNKSSKSNKSNKSKKDNKKKNKNKNNKNNTSDNDAISNNDNENASDNNSLDENFFLSPKDTNNNNNNDDVDNKQQQNQQQQQQRLYRPRVVVPGRQTSSGSYSPSIQQKQQQIFATTTTKPNNLGRYISHNPHNNQQHHHNHHHNNGHHHHHHNQYYNHQALPSRMAMIYTTKPSTTNSSSSSSRHYNIQQFHQIQQQQQVERSRPKKRVMSPSASGKMKEIRNRSQHSPHHHHHNQAATISYSNAPRSNKRPVSLPPQRDREFLKVIQNSVERRQRAHRLSLYQLPDQDDDAWRIE